MNGNYMLMIKSTQDLCFPEESFEGVGVAESMLQYLQNNFTLKQLIVSEINHSHPAHTQYPEAEISISDLNRGEICAINLCHTSIRLSIGSP